MIKGITGIISFFAVWFLIITGTIAFALRDSYAADTTNEIILIDGRVMDIAPLLASLRPSVDIYIIDERKSGADQLIEFIREKTNVKAVHIFSHGAPGHILLGSEVLNFPDIEKLASALRVLKHALPKNILIYGCNVAASKEGALLLSRIAEITGASVAASDDPTGPENLGGDWDLEHVVGKVETASIRAPRYQGVLGTVPVISGLTDLVVDEATTAAVDANVTFSNPDGTGFDGGYIRFELAGSTLDDQLTIQSSGTPNILEHISLSGSEVFSGTGAGTQKIGDVHGTENGMNGQPLRVDFVTHATNPPTNPGFETGDLTGWTKDEAVPNDPGETVTQVVTVDGSVKSEGSYSLKLNCSGSVASYGTGYGPRVTSGYFTATAGDRLIIDWKALDSGDDYDVLAQLVDDNTASTYTLFAEIGDNRDWTTTEWILPVGSTMLKFVFRAGSYDATGGTAIGSILYIDNLRIGYITEKVIGNLAHAVMFRNNSVAPSGAARLMTVEVIDNDNDLGSATSNITITPINGTPVVTAGGGGVPTFTVGGLPENIDGTMTVTDDEDNYTAGLLQAEVTVNKDSQDVLDINWDVNGAGTPVLIGGQIGYDTDTRGVYFHNGSASQEVGTLDAIKDGTAGQVLEIDLTADASSAAIQALARKIRFDNTSSNPVVVAQRTVTFTVMDAASAADSSTASVDIIYREMELSRGATPIADGGSQDFGSQAPNSNTDLIFTITNSGNDNLTLTTPITLGGTDPGQFSIQAQPTSPVASGGGATTFTVRFTPTSTGVKSATIAIANNDSDENPYNFTVTGVGVGTIPTVSTEDIVSIQGNSVQVNGIITNDGGTPITERGVCWSTSPTPTTNDDCVVEIIVGEGKGSFSLSIAQLKTSTTYYVRAYAMNNIGTAYGSEKMFKTKMYFYFWVMPGVMQGKNAP